MRPREVTRTDKRWLVAVFAVFAVTVGSLLAAREVYRATGPHPQLAYVVRRAKFYANSLLRQRFKRARH